ncbi:DUF4271 domain-containing protein [Mucilaginibacter sp. PPCGB 2223]|uniref:DUF4271 domain-containing protein n=1 Tax=Mucilaginibacter sp. PPCGB 2223 TaxID=1886027 RepID=UPI0011123749|nr:DUF4271 domain-containing protein [Mucilaginibacter sp. PPCGB 2223]
MGLKIYMRKVLLFFIAVFGMAVSCLAQADTVRTHEDTLRVQHMLYVADSLAQARKKHTADSLAMLFIGNPDPNRHNQFIDTLLKNDGFDGILFKGGTPRHHIGVGTPRQGRDQWVMWAIFALLIYTGILNRVIGKDIYNIILAFYDKRAFGKISKEESLLTSWAFICLFSLFGFTIGLYIYQITDYYDINYSIGGFQLFITLSVIVIVLFILKILVLRVLAFIFDINRLVNEYISILYLTYFNIAFVFLPVVVGFSLLSTSLLPWLLRFSLLLLGAIFLVQYLRSTINIISNFRFHKIYLFIYLCALEICPILILIKALDI